MIKNSKTVYYKHPLLATCIIILSCFWIFWSPGIRVATDYHLSSKVGLLSIFPWSWREFEVGDGLGEYTAVTLWSQPLLSLSSLLNFTFVGDEVPTKIIGAIILIGGILGIWKLLDYFKLGNWGKCLASVFFILNSFFLLMFDGGQFSLNLAYVSIPYALLAFIKLVESGLWQDRVKFTITILLISSLDIRILFLSVIILGLYLLGKILVKFKARETVKLFKNLYLSVLFTGVILVGFHAYWLLPSFIAKSPSLPLTYDRLDQVRFLSFSSIAHSLFLQQPHWYKNIFGHISQPQFEFILIPILVFLSPILIKRNRWITFWLGVALLGVFLSKGSQDPLSGIYLWLFSYFPFFSVFRDPVKFYFLTALAYSVLIGFTTDAITKLQRINRITSLSIKLAPKLILLYLIILINPMYLGQMLGMISQPVNLEKYRGMANILRADSSFSRVLWLPFSQPLSYSSLAHPLLEASRLSTKRPFAIGTVGTYETNNFLREAPYMGEIFDVAGIGYIVNPYLDPRRDDMHPDNIKYYYTFLDQLSRRPWLTRLENPYIPVLKTKQHQDKFFVSSNTWWVIGSDNIYNQATTSANLRLANNAMIFVEESPGLGNRIDELSDVKVILNNKTNTDFAASFIDPLKLIFPAKSLNFSPDKSGWWKREAADLVSWRAFLRSKYNIDNLDFDLGGGWAIGEGKLELRIMNYELRQDKILLARVMESSRSGELKYYQDGKLLGQINTKNQENNVRWFEVGRLNSDRALTIVSEGDINVVNALAVLDKNEWLGYQDKAKELQERVVTFDEKNAQNISQPAVRYEQINPTKYKVIISNLTQSAFLVFSQNYDGLWKIDNQPSLPVYSLLNGFRVDKNGEYTVEFEPQKYIIPGLIVTAITCFSLIFILVFTTKKFKSRL